VGAIASENVARLGFTAGLWIQELGYDDDVDFDLREAIEDVTGNELADEDWGDVADATILWWRDGDGDLTDTLVDALTLLDEGGVVWVLTPKAGRGGYVMPGEIAQAATTAGLHATSSISVAPEWAGTRLVPSGRAGRGR
jgi:hypothetical protein